LVPVALLLACVIGYACYAYWPVEEDNVMAAPVRSSPPILDPKLPSAIGQFSLKLHHELAKGANNLFYSPLSISTALSMTLAGSKGDTRSQLAAFLKTSDLSDDVVGDSYHAIFQNYKKDDSLHSANLLYTSDQFGINKEYQHHLMYHYLATAKQVDFGQSDAITAEINGAVETETKGKIKDLIPKGTLDASTAVVLVNAVHFKGFWLEQFNTSNTKPQDFTAIDGTVSKVPMMSQKAKFTSARHDDLGARSLTLDYKDSNLSMLILLPNEDTGLPEVELSLANKVSSLASLMEQGFESDIRVQIPKFSLEYEVELTKTLKAMGVRDLVTQGKADLSGVGGNPGDISVSNVIHKAVIEVNEEGAEAAAATAVVMMTRMGPIRREPFIADRPFLFFIVDREAQIPIFAGRYVKP